MNEDLEKTIDKKKDVFLKKSYDISKIEQKVDEILHKTPGKSNKIPGLDVFSLKSKHGTAIYYLKRKKKLKEEKLNKKIIEKAKANLGKRPEKKYEPKNKGHDSISDDIDKVIREYPTDYIEIVKKSKEKDKKKLFKKKIEQKVPDKKIQNNVEASDISELKAKDFAQKHIQSTDKNELPPTPKISDDVGIDQYNKFIDENLNRSAIEEKRDLILEEKSKEKNSFFKRKEKLEPQKENTKTDIGQKNREINIKYGFKIENRPEKHESEGDIDFIEKKLKESPDDKTKVENKVETDKLAQDLVKVHLQDMPQVNNDQKPINKQKTNFQEDQVKVDIPLSETKEGPEHIFFDEYDSFEGWSPHITEKERRKLSLPSINPSPELGLKPLTKDIELPKDVLNINSVTLADLGFSENEWEELEFYPLFEPFVYVEILREKDTLEKRYFLVEMDITKEEKEKLEFILQTMKKYSFDTEEMEAVGDDKYLINSIENIIDEYDLKLDEVSKQKILYYIRKTSLGLGKIDSLMRDPNIEDISCDGAGVPLFLYHRKYGSLRSNIKFENEDELSSFIHRLAQKCGKHISIAEPMLDATMPDGSRIQMTLSDEITAKGSTFTIRKFKDDPFSPPDLFEYNTMSSEMLAYLWLVVENGVNTLFAGGTASGKTTALNAVSLFIPAESKIVSIEETREINLPHVNWIPGVARTGFGGVVVDDKIQGEIDMYDLMKAALRQRPEYILVGEIRGKEAYVLFQAMATGHATYSTVHADSAQSLVHRLEGKPINIPRVMLQALDVICLHITTKVKNARARRCKQIVEIIDIDPTTKEILTNEVFRWDPVQDKFIYSGKSYVLEKIRSEKDFSREKMTNEIKNRQKIIEWMSHNNIRQFREVANIVTRYNENPQEVLKEIEKEENENNKNI